MLHIAPALVRPLVEAGIGAQHPFKIPALRERWAWAQRDWLKATDDTGAGNPEKATAAKGEKYVAAVTERIAAYLVDLAAANLHDMYE